MNWWHKQSRMSLLSIFSYVLIFLILAALAWRDLKEYILPDYLNAALAICFMSFHISLKWEIISPAEALWGGAAGGGFLLLLRSISNRFYKSDSLGLGDVKLIAAAGLGLGHPNIFMALTIGAFIGMLHGLYIARREKKGNIGQVNVPAGVGLAIGIAAVTVYEFGFEWLKIM